MSDSFQLFHRFVVNHCALTDECAAYSAFTGNWDTESLDQPVVYVHVKGYDLVCETGFTEKIDDLLSDVRQWLLHTAGQTTVVVVAAFVEVIEMNIVGEEEDENEGEP